MWLLTTVGNFNDSHATRRQSPKTPRIAEDAEAAAERKASGRASRGARAATSAARRASCTTRRFHSRHFEWTKPARAIVKSHKRMFDRISTAVH
jgi:hypothetical protein